MVYDSAVEAGLKERYLIHFKFPIRVSEGTQSLGTVLAGFFVHGQLHPDLLYHDCDFYHGSFLIWMLKEPSVKVEKADSVTMKQDYLDC